MAPLGARRRRFLALMVGTPGPLAPAPFEGPPSMFLSVDGGCSYTSPHGPAIDVFNLGGDRC
jgi:hypothetical protein